MSTGAYFVSQLDANLFWNGFVSVGKGQNNLNLGNGAIDFEGTYFTETIQIGLAVNGYQKFDGFEFHPELSFAYGNSRIGKVGYDVYTPTSAMSAAFDAGRVELGTISLTPELVIPFANYDNGELRIAPSVTCEFLSTSSTDHECGGGLEFNWSTTLDDGRSTFSARVGREIIGNWSRDTIGLNFNRKF